MTDYLSRAAFTGKTVVGTMNYYPPRGGRTDVLEDRTLTSSEMVQRHLKGAHRVKAFYDEQYGK